MFYRVIIRNAVISVFQCLTKIVSTGHITPMTGGIDNRQKDWFGFGFGKSFPTPYIPIDGIVGMLQQIPRLFMD